MKHRMKWFVWAGGEKIRHTSTMRGNWGYDVECSCGWATNTGGGVKSWLDQEIWYHKWQAKNEEEEA